MLLPDKPRASQLTTVLKMFDSKEISVSALREPVDVKHLKDIARNHPQGVLLIVTTEYLNKFKVICLDGLSLHHGVITECLIEVKLDRRKMWANYLCAVRYFDFYPCDTADEIEILKDEICLHFSSLLMKNANVSYSRATRYFVELDIT